MPPALARRSAGEQVIARSQRLSDDLLTLETQTFAAIRQEYAAAVGEAVEAFGAGWRRTKEPPKGIAGDARMLTRMAEANRRAGTKSKAAVVALADEVVTLALDSIADELAICERTLAQRYAGIRDEAVARARAGAETLVGPRLEAYDVVVRDSVTAWKADAKKQLLLAARYEDDKAEVTKRLFSPTPAAMKGNRGVGVWWRSTQWLNAEARDLSIRLSSQIRLATMAAFNEAGASR